MRQLKSPGPRACLLLLLSFILSSASAIYEDQAGTFDWYKQYIGQPNTVQFIPGRERVYVATSQNLLASLQTKAGSVAWRRRYTDQDPLGKILALQKPAIVLAVSKGGKYLRAWDVVDGGFRWEVLVYESQAAAAAQSSCDIAAVDLGGSRGQAVAVAAGDKLKVFAAARGDLLWSADLELAGQAAQKRIINTESSIAVVAYTPGSSEVHLLSFSAADGSLQQFHTLTADSLLSSNAAVSGSAVAIISSDSQQLCTVLLAADGDESDGSVMCQSISSAAPGLTDTPGGWQLKLLPAGDEQFSLTSGNGVALVKVTLNRAAQTHWFARATAAAPTTAATSLTALASAADSSSVHIELLDTKSGKLLGSSSLEVPEATYVRSGPAPSIAALWLDAKKCSKAASSSSSSSAHKGCQLVLLWSDDQFSFVTNNTIAWNREEALASAQSSIMVDLPAARTAAAAAAARAGSSGGGLLGLLKDQQRLKSWMRLQVLSVLVQFKLNHEHEKQEFYELRQAFSDNNLHYRDTNGFRKLIVLLTATGKLFGLHSGDGRILWAHNSLTIAHSSGGPQQQQQYLRLWKRFHDLTHAPQLAVITAGRASSSVQVVNGHTGAQLQHMELHYGIDKIIPIHKPVHDGAADQFVTLLVEPTPSSSINSDDLPPTPTVHLLPNTPAAQTFISQASSSIFFWLKQTQPTSSHATDSSSDDGGVTTVIRGFGLESAVRPDDQAGGVLPVMLAWQVVLPGQVLGMAAKDPAEPVHSYVKVLGDRSLKYNYLNPNLVFIATGTPLGSGTPPKQASVSVALVNTVTGAVLHQQVHSGCAGPVYAVVSENWVVYTMRDVVNLRQQASVIELYDASHHDLSIESIILGRTQHSTTHSSYSSVTLEVLTQSFYLQHFIKGLSVTQTKQGITTKQLLMQTITDQVYALDKRFLDPRRPLRAKATPEEMEERLVPYNELVLFNTMQYVTQDKQVLNLRGVSVAGAVLESTTLVFSYGADLFYTRISPALNFDSLQSDFSYGLLVVALIVLVVGTWFASYSSQQAMLKAKWQ